jgi:hypothetical protein
MGGREGSERTLSVYTLPPTRSWTATRVVGRTSAFLVQRTRCKRDIDHTQSRVRLNFATTTAASPPDCEVVTRRPFIVAAVMAFPYIMLELVIGHPGAWKAADVVASP